MSGEYSAGRQADGIDAMDEKESTHKKLALLDLAEELGNVSAACKRLGFSRDSYYRFKSAHEKGGVDGLRQSSRKKANLKNRVAPHVEKAVLSISATLPGWGQARVARELTRHNLQISPFGVRSIWKRHRLETARLRTDAASHALESNTGAPDKEPAGERSKAKTVPASQRAMRIRIGDGDREV